MNSTLKTTTTTLGVLAGLLAVGATVYAAKNKKEIKQTIQGDMEGLVDRSAIFLHNKVGFPLYSYIKRKENIPFQRLECFMSYKDERYYRNFPQGWIFLLKDELSKEFPEYRSGKLLKRMKSLAEKAQTGT